MKNKSVLKVRTDDPDDRFICRIQVIRLPHKFVATTAWFLSFKIATRFSAQVGRRDRHWGWKYPVRICTLIAQTGNTALKLEAYASADSASEGQISSSLERRVKTFSSLTTQH